jgi:Family of unknown function (DUF6335)
MSDHRKGKKKEIDADAVIRRYVESDRSPSDAAEDGAQTDWYEQATQDTMVPPQAVLTGGDIDAAWDQAAVGDETVGGSSPTPDQDIVDEIGKALGVPAEEGEPLNTTDKLERRDRDRWELHPASSEDFGSRSAQLDAEARQDKKRKQLSD